MANGTTVRMICANGHRWTGPADMIGDACPGAKKRDDCDGILQRATDGAPHRPDALFDRLMDRGW